MIGSLSCGVEADLETCLPDFIFDDRRFFPFNVELSTVSGPNGVLVPSCMDARWEAGLASLVASVTEGTIVWWNGYWAITGCRKGLQCVRAASDPIRPRSLEAGARTVPLQVNVGREWKRCYCAAIKSSCP